MRQTIHRKKITLFFLHMVALTLFLKPAHAITIDQDETKATILAYHRIGEAAYPDTNLSTEQFAQHLEVLQNGNYNILSLPDIITAWGLKNPLPAQTVAITFEGAYRSSYRNAMQTLIDQKIPFTILYAADSTPAESSSSQHLDWKTLKKLSRNRLITLGTLPASYRRHADKSDIDIVKQINKAISRHKDAFGSTPAFFSYPFGEYSDRYKAAIKNIPSFSAALALNSAVAYNGSDNFALPRFSMTEHYGSLERFTMITEALPLPASDIKITENSISFKSSSQLTPILDSIACFISGQDKPSVTLTDTAVKITATAPVKTTRTRINCTIKDTQNRQDRWRWFGLLVPQAN